MIGRIRNALLLGRRRKEVEAEVEAAYAEIERLRPKKVFRHREWLRESDALDTLRQWLQRAATVDELDKKSKAIAQIVARCRMQVDAEAAVVATLDAAVKRAGGLRERAAPLHGSAFRLAEHRYQALRDECNHARRAKDGRAEEASLKVIAEKLAAFEASLNRAELVSATLPAVEARVAAIEPQEVWLDTGAKETYDDVVATLAETQNDVKRGDYDKAAQRLREIEMLEAHLRDRSNRRAVWAVQEVAMWLSSPAVAAAFPQLARFPQATMRPAEIEELYALRPEIERFVAAHASDQRERNMPQRDLSTGRKLAASHPLRMPLEDCGDAVELEEFLRCVTAAGRGVRPD